MRLTFPLVASATCLLAACTGEPAPAPATPPSQPAPAPTAPAPPEPSADAPAAGHPRLWLTAADLPRLRSWATPANPVWQNGVVPAMQEAIAIYDKEFYPGGQPNPRWPDPGIASWVLRTTEAYAEFFAFLSLVDPDPAARPAHAARARNLLMHVIREAEKGPDPNRQSPAPFRAAAFATYDRANAWGEAFGLTVDWIYPSLTDDDKARIRRVFLRWADEDVRAATSSEEHPQPIGLLDDPRLLADKKRLRWAINNYFTGHMRQLTLFGLALDAADDPPVDPSAPATKLGNTLRSYLADAVGAWLYQQYAVYEDPAVAAPALGVPPEGLGAASGGLSPEGFLYGASLGSLHEALLALHTAGLRDPRAHGPQIRLVDSGFWDRVTDAVLSSIVAEPAPVPGEAWLGPVYGMAAYGDTQHVWLTPGFAALFLSMAVHDAAGGPRDRLDKARWLAVNAMEGTAAGLYKRISHPWGNSTASLTILHFLALDPAAPPPPDPRPKMPLAFVDRALGRAIARSAWGPSGTMFDYKCSFETIGHQFGDCNQIELWRKGEWLIREQSGYANDVAAMASPFHNTIAVQNRVTSGADKPSSLQWFEVGTWAHGGQFTLGMNAGDPKVRIHAGPGWAYAEGDATDLYNRPSQLPGDAAVDVVHASRSVVWLAPDDVVVYDRATTRSDHRFKRFHLVSGGDAAVSGKLATFTTPKGQKLYVRTLLPPSAVLTAAKAERWNGVAEGEPSRSRLMVEDPAGPRDVRFLHVLEAADAGAPPPATSLVRSRAGTPFEGAVVGAFAALFPVDPAAPFTRVTYVVPATTTAQLVGGLRPGEGYDVKLERAGGSIEVTIAAGGSQKADEAGAIVLGSLAAKKAEP